jgi:hypothetical protein
MARRKVKLCRQCHRRLGDPSPLVVSPEFLDFHVFFRTSSIYPSILEFSNTGTTPLTVQLELTPHPLLSLATPPPITVPAMQTLAVDLFFVAQRDISGGFGFFVTLLVKPSIGPVIQIPVHFFTL